jgi:Xaa-Pro dipeptidase
VSSFTRRDVLAAGAAALGACAGGRQEKPESAPRLDPALVKSLTGRPKAPLPPFPANAHAERRGRLRDAMERQGIDALFLGPTVNLDYFTGVKWSVSERLFGCVVFREDPLVWITPKFEERRAKESVDGLGELHAWEEWEDPHTLLHAILLTRGAVGTVAVDSHVRATHALRLARHLRGTGVAPEIDVRDGLPLTAAVRSVKTEPEIARIRRACEWTQEAIRVVREKVLVPGATEEEVSAAVNAAQRALGLTNTWALVLFGENAAFPHGTKHRRPLARGDAALFDCGGELEGYQSDISRTFFEGGPSAKQRRVYGLVRQAQKAALAAARPGVPCQDVDRAARAVVEAGGFGPKATFFTHRLGHGIGREGHEDPYFCEGNATLLEPGMTLSNEPGIYIPGEFGVRLEDIVVITDQGAETMGAPAAEEP